MSIDLSSFNPRVIPETEEKQMYREQAIPTPVRFIQNYIETAIDGDNWQGNRCVSPDIFFVLFENFCNQQREQKKWSCKQFQICIAKYLDLKADNRDRTNNGNKCYYDLGESAEQFLQVLIDKKLYSSF